MSLHDLVALVSRIDTYWGTRTYDLGNGSETFQLG